MTSFQTLVALHYRSRETWEMANLLVDVDLTNGPAGKSVALLIMGLGRARFLKRPDGRFDTPFVLARGNALRLRGKIFVDTRGIQCPFALGEDVPGVFTRLDHPVVALVGYGRIVYFR